MIFETDLPDQICPSSFLRTSADNKGCKISFFPFFWSMNLVLVAPTSIAIRVGSAFCGSGHDSQAEDKEWKCFHTHNMQLRTSCEIQTCDCNQDTQSENKVTSIRVTVFSEPKKGTECCQERGKQRRQSTLLVWTFVRIFLLQESFSPNKTKLKETQISSNHQRKKKKSVFLAFVFGWKSIFFALTQKCPHICFRCCCDIMCTFWLETYPFFPHLWGHFCAKTKATVFSPSFLFSLVVGRYLSFFSCFVGEKLSWSRNILTFRTKNTKQNKRKKRWNVFLHLAASFAMITNQKTKKKQKEKKKVVTPQRNQTKRHIAVAFQTQTFLCVWHLIFIFSNTFSPTHVASLWHFAMFKCSGWRGKVRRSCSWGWDRRQWRWASWNSGLDGWCTWTRFWFSCDRNFTGCPHEPDSVIPEDFCFWEQKDTDRATWTLLEAHETLSINFHLCCRTSYRLSFWYHRPGTSNTAHSTGPPTTSPIVSSSLSAASLSSMSVLSWENQDTTMTLAKQTTVDLNFAPGAPARFVWKCLLFGVWKCFVCDCFVCILNREICRRFLLHTAMVATELFPWPDAMNLSANVFKVCLLFCWRHLFFFLLLLLLDSVLIREEANVQMRRLWRNLSDIIVVWITDSWLTRTHPQPKRSTTPTTPTTPVSRASLTASRSKQSTPPRPSTPHHFFQVGNCVQETWQKLSSCQISQLQNRSNFGAYSTCGSDCRSFVSWRWRQCFVVVNFGQLSREWSQFRWTGFKRWYKYLDLLCFVPFVVSSILCWCQYLFWDYWNCVDILTFFFLFSVFWFLLAISDGCGPCRSPTTPAHNDKSFVVSILHCLISNANNTQQQQQQQQQQSRQPSGKNYFTILTDVSTPSSFSRNPETHKQSIAFIVWEQQ